MHFAKKNGYLFYDENDLKKKIRRNISNIFLM